MEYTTVSVIDVAHNRHMCLKVAAEIHCPIIIYAFAGLWWIDLFKVNLAGTFCMPLWIWASMEYQYWLNIVISVEKWNDKQQKQRYFRLFQKRNSRYSRVLFQRRTISISTTIIFPHIRPTNFALYQVSQFYKFAFTTYKKVVTFIECECTGCLVSVKHKSSIFHRYHTVGRNCARMWFYAYSKYW